VVNLIENEDQDQDQDHQFQNTADEPAHNQQEISLGLTLVSTRPEIIDQNHIY
jgi:hypothetical protein